MRGRLVYSPISSLRRGVGLALVALASLLCGPIIARGFASASADRHVEAVLLLLLWVAMVAPCAWLFRKVVVDLDARTATTRPLGAPFLLERRTSLDAYDRVLAVPYEVRVRKRTVRRWRIALVGEEGELELVRDFGDQAAAERDGAAIAVALGIGGGDQRPTD